MTYFFNGLRAGARRRGLQFNLTLAQFREWCALNNFMALKGRQPHSMTVDRIDRSKGYSLDNIQMLSFSANSAQGKYNLPRYLREEYERINVKP